MRLFVAVDLDDAIRRSVVKAIDPIKNRIARMSGVSATWVQADHLHLTLSFIGEVGEELAAAVTQVMSDSLPFEPFAAALSDGGVFPPSGPPRVIWFAVGEGQEAFGTLYTEVARRLQTVRIEPEKRPFRTHLTVGRLKQASGGSGRAIRELLSTASVGGQGWRVDHVTLYQSKLSPQGPTYIPLAKIPLITGGPTSSDPMPPR